MDLHPNGQRLHFLRLLGRYQKLVCVQDGLPPTVAPICPPGHESRFGGHRENLEIVRVLLDSQSQQIEEHLVDCLSTLLMCLWVFIERV